MIQASQPVPGTSRIGGGPAVFMLKALPAAMVLVFSTPGWAIDGAAGLPQNGVVFSGAATGSVSGNQLTINQATARAVVDWASFNIDAGKAVLFVQPNAASAMLNRVTGDANPSQILGSLSANGTVMLMNPNGVMFGQGAVVNVGSLIATTGNIDVNNFINTGGAVITGAVGSIGNQGAITAQNAGLVALVAPSVTNQGSIAAIGGKIALAGSTAATVSLNGGLYEFAIPAGAVGTAVSNAAGASLNAANLLLGVGDAANLLSGVINLEGVQQASNAIVVNGDTVVLRSALQASSVSGSSNTVNVSGAARIQDGVNIAKSGGAVNVAAGTYVQPGTLKINKSLTLSGAGEGATIIDAQGVSNYGMHVTGDNVTLKDFTLYGPSANVSASYGIKVAPSGGTSARLHDFSISNVTIRGSGRAELDLNGVVGAVIDHVTADGAPVGNPGGSTAGAGIQVTDSANVTVSNSTTRNNEWGGLALYQSNRFHDQQVNNITVAANNSFTERNPVYMQDESASRDFGALSIAGFDYAVRNSSSVNGNLQYTWLQASQQNAFDFAVNLGAAASSYVQGWNGAVTTQNFQVGTGNLLAGGSQAMSIGSAIGAAGTGAAVDVYAGTYAEQLVLNKTGLTLTGHDGAKLVVPDAADVNGITVTANDVKVTGMEIAGPVIQSYLSYPWGNNISRGIVVRNGVTNFTLSNNNIHDLRTGILIDGRNTGSVTGNRIENTKSGISVQYTDGTGIAISGNSQGPIGNEWGLNLHLNGHMVGANPNPVSNSTPIAAAPTLSAQQGLLDLSGANGGWSVQDLGYTSSNRTHVNVAAGGSSSAQGSALTPINTIQGGVNAVVTGGFVSVAAGDYSENVTIAKALTLDGAGVGQTILRAPSSTTGNAVSINASDVTLSDLSINDSLYGVQMQGTSNNVTIDRVAFNNNQYGVRNGTQVKADNFRMLNSTITGGLVGFQTYNSYNAGTGLANGSFKNALFENVTVDGTSFKGFYFETADNLTMRNVTVANAGNVGDPTSHAFGAGIDVNLKYDAFSSLTFDNVVVRNSGYSSGTGNGVAMVVKTRGIPGDGTDYTRSPASLQSVSIIGGSIEDSTGTGLRIETLSNGHGGQPAVTIGGGTQFRNNATDIAVDQTNVDASGAVFVGAADGFAIEDRVTHALDSAGRGLVTWTPGNVYVTQSSGSIQRGADALSAGGTVNVAAGTYAEDVTLGNRYRLLFNDTTLRSLTLDAGAAGSGLGGKVTANGAGGFLFNAAVNLLADTTLATTGADITLNGDIQNAGATAYGLGLIAGTGGTRGNVHMVSGGTEGNALGQFEVSSNKFSLLSTLWVKGYGINALGDVALSNHTLRGQDAGAANSLNAGGNVTGSTISLGNVAITSGGDILANISGSNVVVQAQGNVNVVVTASNSASLAGNAVVANVAAPVVAVAAVGDAQISGSSSQITVNAPSGSVSGNFGQVSNTGGGLVNVNGKPQGSQQLSANSENNRVIPAGNTLVDNAGAEGVQLAQAGGSPGQGDVVIHRSSPGAAGDALDNGQAVELDLSPRNSQDKVDGE
ncbi:beta strand repeat-containing protein [Polaromonas sp.]|uniref:beta strand repeat-containing protein n=1 Tax=Polaromonas sp. TaxID=1869339 RepID=UPI003BAA7355